MNSYFDTDYFNYLICYIYFVNDFVTFFYLRIIRENYSDKKMLSVILAAICNRFCLAIVTLNRFVWQFLIVVYVLVKNFNWSFCFCGLFSLSCSFCLHSAMLRPYLQQKLHRFLKHGLALQFAFFSE